MQKDLSSSKLLTDYAIARTNKDGKILGRIIRGNKDKLQKRPFYVKKLPLLPDRSEYLTVSIDFPYHVFFNRMILLIVASLVLGVLIVYCIAMQISFIFKQNKIAILRQDFTQSMIHDMKNPITAIKIGIDAVGSGKLDNRPELKKHYVESVDEESDNLMALVERILTIAKLESGKEIVLAKEKMNFKELMEPIMEEFRIKSKTKVDFKTDFGDIGEIFAEKVYLTEAVKNIIDNAVKYSKGDKAEIEIGGKKENGYSVIRIKDHGIGISKKDCKTVFDKFERAYSVAKDKDKNGFGLGLNYVYQVVKAHGGSVAVESRLGQYSEFTIKLPDKND